MLYNFLDNTQARTIQVCNYNQHIRSVHMDRIMDEHDLIYIRAGTWQICQDGISYELIPGDVILLQGGHHHYGLHPCESTVKTCFIHFSACSRDAIKEKEACSHSWVFPVVVHCKNNPMVEHYFNRIIYTYWSEGEYAEKKASAYLDLLLCEIASTRFPVQNSTMVEQIQSEIKKTPDRFIGIEELAAKYNLSVRTISSKFKKCTGYSLHAWQMKLKCQMADELIRSNPSLTLKEIAATYGFYDEYHFGKCFKKTMGHSPKRLK